MDAYKIEDLLFEELITFDLEAEDYKDAIRKVGELTTKLGYTTEKFAEDVIAREVLYPTALPTEVLKVAIPHPMVRDSIIKSGIVITKLKKPVDFILMGSDEDIVPVDIMFTLAVGGEKDQLTILQKLVGMFCEADAMQKIKDATTPEATIKTLVELLK